ncbi:MAG: 2-amino-4-hydroxy-6-hydroxymethyldihydropteridine diphosphokinase [Oligoflexales bacterium]
MVLVKQANHRYLLSFGSNLGNRQENCQFGLELLSQHVRNIRCSRWISTEPLTSPEYDTTDHQDYLNFVLEVSSCLSPAQLYRMIVSIEDKIGHSRADKWLPRQLDIDILFWANNDHRDFVSCSPLSYSNIDDDLLIPHQGFWSRDFLLNLIEKDLCIPLHALRAGHRRPVHEL